MSMGTGTGRAARTSRRGPLVLAAVVAAAVVVAVLVALSASGGDGDGGASGGTATIVGVEEVRAELAGVPVSGMRLGRADAPVRIEEYADLQCPFCAQAAAVLVPEIVERYVRPGTASMTFRPLAFIGEDSRRGALAAYAAGYQNRSWQLVEVLFRNQGKENAGWLSDETILAAADAVGIDRERLNADRASDRAEQALAADAAAARKDGVESTPTFVVSGPGGTRVIAGAQDIRQLAAAVEEVRG